MNRTAARLDGDHSLDRRGSPCSLSSPADGSGRSPLEAVGCNEGLDQPRAGPHTKLSPKRDPIANLHYWNHDNQYECQYNKQQPEWNTREALTGACECEQQIEGDSNYGKRDHQPCNGEREAAKGRRRGNSAAPPPNEAAEDGQGQRRERSNVKAEWRSRQRNSKDKAQGPDTSK